MKDKYVSTKLFINGSWVNSIKNETIDINNPASGDLIGCFGLTEPNFGSNPSGMLTNIKKTEGGYILNGS